MVVIWGCLDDDSWLAGHYCSSAVETPSASSMKELIARVRDTNTSIQNNGMGLLHRRLRLIEHTIF